MKIERQLWEGYLAYRDDAERSRYDYRGNRAYREAFCEHGTSRWTDYDNICGGCENGVTMSDGMQRRAAALSDAKERYAKFKELCQARETLMGEHGIDLPVSVRSAIVDKCAEYMLWEKSWENPE